MSMFFIVDGFGNYSEAYDWDYGIKLLEPKHATRQDIQDFYPEDFSTDFYYPVSIDKRTCPEVQTLFLNEHGGSRNISLLVKAKGYLQAKERAEEFCNVVYPPTIRW